MPWTREEKLFCLTIPLKITLFKTLQSFAGSLTLRIIPRKTKFMIGFTNFKPWGQ